MLLGEQHGALMVEYAADERTARLSLDIADAWGNDVGLDRWHRCVALCRNECVEITDHWKFRSVPNTVQFGVLPPG